MFRRCGLIAWLWLAGCGEQQAPFAQPASAKAGASAEDDAPRAPRTPRQEPDAGADHGAARAPRDAGPAGDRDAGTRDLDGAACVDCDAAAAPLQPGPLVLPEVADAERSGPDARVDRSCAGVPGVAGFYTPASLHVIDDLAYVFSVDASDPSPRVLMHVTPVAELWFGNPAPLLQGAHEVDLIEHGDELRALVGRQFYSVELASLDGFVFSEDQVVGPHQPTYNCEGFPPPRYFRGRETAELIAVGSDFNGGLFGCQERVFVARRDGIDWAEPVEVGRGDAVYAYQGASRATLVTTLGVLQSTDDGASFQTVTGLEAAGGAFTGSRLVLIRAAGDGVRALLSDDDGASWSAQTRVLADQPIGGAFVAVDGEHLAVASATASEIVLTTSADDAVRWTEPRRIPRPSWQRLLAIAQHGNTTLWLTAGQQDALELCALR